MPNPKNPITLLTLAFVSGCSAFNPCEVSALYANMTLEQQQLCDQCNNAYSCEVDETGGEEPDGILTCSTDLDHETYTQYCFKGQWSAEQIGEQPGQIEHIPASSCRTLSANSYPCYRSWLNLEQPGGPSECVACDLLIGTYAEVGGPTDWLSSFGPFAQRQVDWGICNEGHLSTYGSGLHSDPEEWGLSAEEQTAPWANLWGSPMHCQNGFHRTAEVPWKCDVVQIRDGSPTSNEAGMNWTCACATDADCQPGAVCEAGGTMDGGYPHHTLCTWDDGAGTSNGIAPEGPIVYGLARWEDGIRAVRGGNITITGAMYTAMREGAVLNDDQRFGLAGELTHCGRDALCAYLGLGVGDLVMIDTSDTEALERGEVVEVPVRRVDGSTLTWTVAIDFDGF